MSVFSLSNLKKTWYYLQKNGIRNAVWAVLERIGQEQEVYTWQEPDEKTLSFQREHSASLRISIVVPAGSARKMHRLETGAPARRQTGEGERRTGEIENCAHAAACAQFFK